MRGPVLGILLPVAAWGGYALAGLLYPPSAPPPGETPEPPPAVAVRPPPAVATPAKPAAAPKPAAALTLSQTGSGAIPEMHALTAEAGVAELKKLAAALLADPKKRRDQGLWAPLLARWAAVDGAGLVEYAGGLSSAADRLWLEGKSWHAWGAADPAAAAAAGGALPTVSREELIRGMARADANAALKFALRSPNAQTNFHLLGDALRTLPPERREALLPAALYEGMRMPLHRARAAALAETDPAAALASAVPVYGRDSVSGVMSMVAERDPAAAAELLHDMPSGRSRALSSLSLARAWAREDSAAAAAWARADLTGPVRQSALLEIAAESGGAEPHAGLALVEEAGWESQGNFGAVRGGNMVEGEAFGFPTPERAAGRLLQQLAILDPAAARRYLQERVPEGVRAQVAKIAGLATASAPSSSSP